MSIQISIADSDDLDFKELSTELEKELYMRDGQLADINHEMNKIDFLPTVIVLYSGEQPVACGGYQHFNNETVEIKRMYVHPNFRQKGLATQVLNQLEQLANKEKLKYILLETGKNQPEAIAFYLKMRYEIVENFGKYVGSVNSVCFTKGL